MTDDTRLLPSDPPPEVPPPPRRRWVKRGIIGFLIVANVAIFGGLAAVWLAARQVSSAVSTLPEGEVVLAEEPASLGDPRTFLLVGSDSRANLPSDFTGFGSFGGQRADVIMLVKVHPDDGRVQLLSLPRDLKISWNGATTKINGTFNDGPGELVAAVSAFTGAPVHHYMQVEFAGFASIVDAIGGVEMTFPFPARDRKSDFRVDAGTHLLDGKTALALARSRTYEENRGGGWVAVEASDFGRTGRQQDLLMAIITQIDRPSSIDGFGDLIEALGGFVIVDETFDEDDIIQLAWEMRSVSASDLDAVTLPARISNEGGVSYVIPVEPESGAILAAFREGEALVTSDSLAIEVQNGNGRVGAAGAVADLLGSEGFDVVGVGDSGRTDYGTTVVLGRPNLLSVAEDVVDALGFGSVEAGRTPEGVDLVVIVGLDAPAG